MILCLALILNLAAEAFHHYSDFKHTSDMIAMIKSSLFKKPNRKSRYLKYLNDFITMSEVKLLPVPISSRWNSWFETAMYHATRVHLYGGFTGQRKEWKWLLSVLLSWSAIKQYIQKSLFSSTSSRRIASS